MMRSAFDRVSACESVLATTKSTPWRPAVIMLLTALPPAPPTPKTVMRGLSSRMSGIFRLMVMVASSLIRGRGQRPASAGPPPAVAIFRLRIAKSSEALTKPLSDAGEIAARAVHQIPPAARLEVLEVRRLRINQQTRRRGECRAFGRIGQPGDAERPSAAHRPAENAGGELGQSVELTGAAGKNDASARLAGEQRNREPVAHHLQDLLDARLDDVSERGAGYELRLLALIPADWRHRDHVGFVRSADQHTAIKRFDSLGIGDAGIEPARDVH